MTNNCDHILLKRILGRGIKCATTNPLPQIVMDNDSMKLIIIVAMTCIKTKRSRTKTGIALCGITRIMLLIPNIPRNDIRIPVMISHESVIFATFPIVYVYSAALAQRMGQSSQIVLQGQGAVNAGSENGGHRPFYPGVGVGGFAGIRTHGRLEEEFTQLWGGMRWERC